jgi:hypothetical protein
VILNFDETIIKSTCPKTFTWERTKEGSSREIGRDISNLSMFTAITNRGDIFFQFVKGNSNEASVSSFILELADTLDKTKPDWRKDHIFLLDNCSTHKTSTVIKLINCLKIPTLFSAPASYLVAPIERLFASIKNCNFE